MTTQSLFSSRQMQLLARLTLPLIFTGFLESSTSFFSTLFLARLGSHELAAGAVVLWIFFTIIVIIWGTLSSVSVVVAQKYGEQNFAAIPVVLRDGLLLALLLSVPVVILMRHISYVLAWLGQQPDLIQLGQSYMDALSWGIPFDFFGMLVFQFLLGLGHTRTNLVFTLAWVPLNILSNYIFVFGKFGAPALGMAGIGWGTSLAFAILAAVLLLFLCFNKIYRPYVVDIFKWRKTQYVKELIAVGLPMGSMYCIEVAFFLTFTLMMGKFGSALLAANQITLQYLGIASVVTFALTQGVTVRIGHSSSEGHLRVVEQITAAGLILAVAFMLLVLLAYVLLAQHLIAIDLDIHDPANTAIIMYAKKFLLFCGLFQVIEAFRFILFGALRGYKDTRSTLLVSILSYWGISLPVGYGLAVGLDLHGTGLWTGVLIGQAIAVVLLFYRFRFKVRYAARVRRATLQN